MGGPRESDPEDPQPGELIRWGRIASVELAAATCTVEAGELVTGPVRWMELRAGATRSWSPPSVGEQVLLVCAEGELAAGVALRGIVSTAFPAPGATLRELTQFADGTVLAYDPEAHLLEAILCEGGSATIVADGGVTITGPVSITGDVTITGTVDVSDDVVAAGISLVEHIHGGVQTGGGSTGAPE